MGHLMTSTAPVLHFRDVGLGDVPTVGGKGASLGELLRAGIRVPTGYAVTTAAFRLAVEHLTVHGGTIPARVAALDPADGPSLADASAELRAAVESAPLPDEVAQAGTPAHAAPADARDAPSPPPAVPPTATSQARAGAG